jgi:hypothetical protein
LVAVVDRLMANRREDRYATATEAAEALQAVGGCAPSPQYGGRPDPEVVGASGCPGSIGGESLLRRTSWSTRSTIVCPAVATGRWLGLLTHPWNWSPWVRLLLRTVALLVTFVAGFLFHRHLIGALDVPSRAISRPLTNQPTKE